MKAIKTAIFFLFLVSSSFAMYLKTSSKVQSSMTSSHNPTSVVTKQYDWLEYDDNYGDIFHLERYNVDCGDDAIMYWYFMTYWEDWLFKADDYYDRVVYACFKTTGITTGNKVVHTTSWNDIGSKDHSIIYLDRHHVSCPGSTILVQFVFQRMSGDLIRYSYTCKSTNLNLTNCHNKSTSNSSYGNMDIYYLDRQGSLNTGEGHQIKKKWHYIDKNSDTWLREYGVGEVNKVIQGFQMYSNHSSKTINYGLKVCYAFSKVDSNNMFTANTQTDSDGDGNIIFLDRLSVDCGDHASLYSFLYKRDGEGSAYYQFKCWKPSYIGSTRTVKYTNWSGYGSNGQTALVYLDRHHVSCDGNTTLSQFNLETNGGSIRYRYTCTSLTITLKSSHTVNTPGTHNGGRIYYLDRQTQVSNTSTSMILKGFQLQPTNGNQIQYKLDFNYV